MADETVFTIDDRRSGNHATVTGGNWRLVTDGVMGGVSSGRMTVDKIDDRPCLRLSGDVSTDNNGGFIQAALDLDSDELSDASAYQGIAIDVYGNDESYNLHLRQDGLWLPWQAFRATFTTSREWQTHYLPFTGFQPHATRAALKPDRLKRIGLFAIGRRFDADV